jgi:hypothetical protein
MAMGRRIVMALALAAAGLASRAAGGAVPSTAAPRAEVDVVVETGLLTTPEHRKEYLATMLEYARGCLAGLVPPKGHDPATEPPPGAARYRLFIEHRGKVEVGAAGPAELRGDLAGEAALQWITRQEGVFRFRLARWDGAAYPTVDQWSSTYRTEHFLPMPADASPDDQAQYRRIALELATPEAVKGGILRRLVPVTLADSSGTPGSAQKFTLRVRNASRWPIARVGVTAVWCVKDEEGGKQYRYLAEASHDGRIEPGGQVDLKGMAERDPSPFAWEYAQPTQIDVRPVFAPAGDGAK